MGAAKGQNQFYKFQSGAKLTRKQAMLAKCYECNGEEESRVDCDVPCCPLYSFSPYRGIKPKMAVLPCVEFTETIREGDGK